MGYLSPFYRIAMCVLQATSRGHCGACWRTKLRFLTSYHPQTDGQMEVVNRSLGNLLRSLVGDNLTTWDLFIPHAEFAYNTLADRTTSMSPFEVAHGLVPRKPRDLVPVDPHIRASDDGVAFAQHVSELHKYIHDRITQ